MLRHPQRSPERCLYADRSLAFILLKATNSDDYKLTYGKNSHMYKGVYCTYSKSEGCRILTEFLGIAKLREGVKLTCCGREIYALELAPTSYLAIIKLGTTVVRDILRHLKSDHEGQYSSLERELKEACEALRCRDHTMVIAGELSRRLACGYTR